VTAASPGGVGGDIDDTQRHRVWVTEEATHGGGNPRRQAVQICAAPTTSPLVPTLLLLPVPFASLHSVVAGDGAAPQVE
jgi:hypothetical protein